MNNMTNHIQTLKRFNAWCRGEDTVEVPNPNEISQAIEWLIDENASLELSRDAWKEEAEIQNSWIIAKISHCNIQPQNVTSCQ